MFKPGDLVKIVSGNIHSLDTFALVLTGPYGTRWSIHDLYDVLTNKNVESFYYFELEKVVHKKDHEI